MTILPQFREDLIRRYDKPGPRYTSYPPATEFKPTIGDSDYRKWAGQSNEDPIVRPLSLYFHIPFCSSICYYCACNKVITKRKEKAEPYLQDLYREIEIQARLYDDDREVLQLHWGGGTPGFLSHEQSQQLMQTIERHFRLNFNDENDYSIEIDPRVVEAGGMAHLRKLGFNRISIGVQDFNQQVQQAVNRQQSHAQTASVIREARNVDFRSINIDLIYGLPHQSMQTMAETLKSVLELEPDRIAVYNYAHLPHRFPPQRRINAEDLPSPSEKLDMMQQIIEFLCAVGYRYIGMDHFARGQDELAVAQQDGSLHRNFQGYSAHAQCDSIGLGVSAISMVADNFSQNTTSLEDYHAALQKNRLPVIRGYQSNRDDLIRREVIQSLICHFLLDIREIERRWKICFEKYFADELVRLEEMQQDGLLVLSDDEIRIDAAGRLLIRNICMTFDVYQHRAQVTNLFSRTV